jgi:hypothetical protein
MRAEYILREIAVYRFDGGANSTIEIETKDNHNVEHDQ